MCKVQLREWTLLICYGWKHCIHVVYSIKFFLASSFSAHPSRASYKQCAWWSNQSSYQNEIGMLVHLFFERWHTGNVHATSFIVGAYGLCTARIFRAKEQRQRREAVNWIVVFLSHRSHGDTASFTCGKHVPFTKIHEGCGGFVLGFLQYDVVLRKTTCIAKLLHACLWLGPYMRYRELCRQQWNSLVQWL